jgi:hypothetical protein
MPVPQPHPDLSPNATSRQGEVRPIDVEKTGPVTMDGLITGNASATFIELNLTVPKAGSVGFSPVSAQYMYWKCYSNQCSHPQSVPRVSVGYKQPTEPGHGAWGVARQIF